MTTVYIGAAWCVAMTVIVWGIVRLSDYLDRRERWPKWPHREPWTRAQVEELLGCPLADWQWQRLLVECPDVVSDRMEKP